MSEMPPFLAVSTKVYRLLLNVYPKPFQAEFGEEMLSAFSDLLADAMQRRGLFGVAVTWFDVLGDFCSSVAYQHWLVLGGRLTMLRKTLSKRWLLGTVFTVSAVVAVVMAANRSPKAKNVDSPPPLVTWDGTLEQFPAGATLTDPKKFTFIGADGAPVAIALPTVTWTSNDVEHQ